MGSIKGLFLGGWGSFGGLWEGDTRSWGRFYVHPGEGLAGLIMPKETEICLWGHQGPKDVACFESPVWVLGRETWERPEPRLARAGTNGRTKTGAWQGWAYPD